MTKVRQTFQISLTDVNCVCAIYAVRTVSNPPPPTPLPRYNIFYISNGPYDQFVAWKDAV